MRVLAGRAGFEQQYPPRGVLAEARGERGPSRAGPHDHDINTIRHLYPLVRN
ncbi:unannotated protein [freshwater metagenome]|uniref:Unannotated protein n=1 Tax=freshwater metagenome TaxID=449393 RepID=A0A6J6V212_9ZZZZ